MERIKLFNEDNLELMKRIPDESIDVICIDPCIVDEVKELWSLGIETLGCCCRHNKAEPFVNVHEKDIEKMLSLGYVQNHPDKSRNDTFKLKSV